MPWGAAAVAVGTIASGYMQGQAAKSAAQTQADAAARADAGAAHAQPPGVCVPTAAALWRPAAAHEAAAAAAV